LGIGVGVDFALKSPQKAFWCDLGGKKTRSGFMGRAVHGAGSDRDALDSVGVTISS